MSATDTTQRRTTHVPEPGSTDQRNPYKIFRGGAAARNVRVGDRVRALTGDPSWYTIVHINRAVATDGELLCIELDLLGGPDQEIKTVILKPDHRIGAEYTSEYRRRLRSSGGIKAT